MPRAPKRKQPLDTEVPTTYPTQQMQSFYRYLETKNFAYECSNPYRPPHWRGGLSLIPINDTRGLELFRTLPYDETQRLHVTANFFVEESRLPHFNFTCQSLHTLQEIVFQNESFWHMFKTESGDCHWISVFAMVCTSWKKAMPMLVIVEALAKAIPRSLYNLGVSFGFSQNYILKNVAPYETRLHLTGSKPFKDMFEGRDLDACPFQIEWTAQEMQSHSKAISHCLSYDAYNCFRFMDYKIKEDPNNLDLFKTKMDQSKGAWKSRLEKSRDKRQTLLEKKEEHWQRTIQILKDEGIPTNGGWHSKAVNDIRVNFLHPISMQEVRFLCYIQTFYSSRFNALKRQWNTLHPKTVGATHYAERQLAQELAHLDFANTRFCDLPRPSK